MPLSKRKPSHIWRFPNLLSCRSKKCNLFTKPNSIGIELEKILLSILSVLNALRFQNIGEIIPLRWLPNRSKMWSKDKLPRDGESLPSKFNSGRLITTTVSLCCLHTIASQMHSSLLFSFTQLSKIPARSCVMAIRTFHCEPLDSPYVHTYH